MEGETLRKFWERVQIKHPDECWPWVGSFSGTGYGSLRVGKKMCGAHRLSFEIAHGHEARPLVRHTCDNRRCVNPAHLLEGSYADNVRDMISRGRHRCGGVGGTRKLTWEAVREIRANYQYGRRGYGSKCLAKKFGVTYQTVFDVLKNEIWREHESGDIRTSRNEGA